MISTSRGLSAVRPGDGLGADDGGLWHRELRQPPVEVMGEVAVEFACDTGHDRQGVLGDAVHPARGRQLAVDTEDSDSTATTSALVV
jgi:hypothetical protein